MGLANSHAGARRIPKYNFIGTTNLKATMASLLLRSLTRSTRMSTTSGQLRHIASSTSLFQATSEARTRSVFDYHTVEDLHGMSAADILAEPETRTDSKMRHFTGELE